MAEKITRGKLHDLIQDDRNLNKGTERGQKLIEKSLRQFGAGRSLLLDKNNRIIAGNKTHANAEAVGIDDVIIVETDGTKMVAVKRTDVDLDTKQGREMALADNATGAANLEWNTEELESVADDFGIAPDDWDVEMLEEEITNETIESEENEMVESLLNETTRKIAGDIILQYDTLKGFSFITPNTAKFDFIRFAYYNKSYPRYNSLAFHPNQFITSGDNYSCYEGLRRVQDGETKSERLRFVCSDKFNKIIGGSLAFSGAKMPLDFPADLARNLIEEFCQGGRVLDPCAGWGGRLIGFLASSARYYDGTDASPYQCEGIQKIYDTFKDVAKDEKDCVITCSPFEKRKLKKSFFDMAITSPPYFDREKYIGGEQSRDSKENYEDWRDNFYAVLIAKVYDALKPNGVFCLQVGSQFYPLLEDGKKIAQNVGFKIEGVRATDMTNNQTQTETEDGEVVIILRK